MSDADGAVVLADVLLDRTVESDFAEECVICYESLYSQRCGVLQRSCNGVPQRVCRHIFHLRCCRKLRRSGARPSCPICRQTWTEVKPLPLLSVDPEDWFDTVCMEGGGVLPSQQVEEALLAQFPLSKESLAESLPKLWERWDPNGTGALDRTHCLGPFLEFAKGLSASCAEPPPEPEEEAEADGAGDGMETTSLHFAVAAGRVDAARSLAESESAPAIGLALREAAERGDAAVALALVEVALRRRQGSQAAGGARRRRRLDPFHFGWALREAAMRGHLEVVGMLAQRAPLLADDVGSALREAAQAGDVEMVRLLARHAPSGDSAFGVGWALREAALRGHAEVCAVLTQFAASDDVGAALREAVESGRSGLAAGAVLAEHAPSCDVSAALRSAAERNDVQMVAVLVEWAAANATGWALLQAAKAGHVEAVQALVGRAPRDDSIYGVAWALREAAVRGKHEAVAVLVEHAGDDGLDGGGGALGDAAESGQLEVVRVLMPRASSGDIEWAVLRAARKGHVEVTEALVASADLDEAKRIAVVELATARRSRNRASAPRPCRGVPAGCQCAVS